MNITNLFKIALKAIGANKMRSFLTMLGNGQDLYQRGYSQGGQ